MLKDYNDLLVNGYQINSLQTVPLDIAALNIMLADSTDKRSEYKIATDFCKTVRDNMVKSDIATMLSKRWDKDIAEVKDYIKVRGNNDEELLQKMHGFDDCWTDMKKFMSEEGTGLGLKSLDESIGGIKRKEVVLLGAYTNQGKSFLAAKIAAHRLLKYNDNVMIFSMEMPRGQFLQEIILEILHMNERTFLDTIKTQEGAKLFEQVKEKLERKLIIVDEPSKNIDDLWKFTQLAQANDFNVDFVVFDHFHLIPNIDDIPTLTENANKMKDYVKHFNLRLLMLCQFNEESQMSVYGKKAKPSEPILKNIKGANALKAIADVVLLVWRPYFTDVGLDPIEREKIRYDTGIKIGKQRRRLKGEIKFTYRWNPRDNSLKEVVTDN